MSAIKSQGIIFGVPSQGHSIAIDRQTRISWLPLAQYTSFIFVNIPLDILLLLEGKKNVLLPCMHTILVVHAAVFSAS